MTKPMKTATISEVIKSLQEIKKEVGDIPVYMSKDPEGNGYGTIRSEQNISFGVQQDLEPMCLIIWPWEEFQDFPE